MACLISEYVHVNKCSTYGNILSCDLFVLKGQFWNIPVSAAKLTDPILLAQLPKPDYNHSNLYMITVQPADSPERSFFGELFGNHWDSYKSPCLYAGNSQVRFSAHYS